MEGRGCCDGGLDTDRCKPNSSAYYLLAVAYYQQELYSRLAPAQKAVELAEKPQESWIQLVLALHLQEENWAEAVPLLVRLINLYPEKKTYWVQLSSVYGQKENTEGACNHAVGVQQRLDCRQR